MADLTLHRTGASITLRIADGRTLELSPQECWDAAAALRRFIVEGPPVPGAPVAVTVRKNGVSFRVVVSRNIGFWDRLERGEWEPETYRLFDRFIAEDCLYIDAGAWIGPTVLYAAQRARKTYAFEPDPVAYRELASNLASNAGAEWASRVTLFNKAVTARGGTVRLGSRGAFGDALSSVLFPGEELSREVEAVSLEEIFVRPDAAGREVFIKMDIEGAEYEVIPRLRKALARRRVHLFLSIHPDSLMHSLRLRPGGGAPREESLFAKFRRRFVFAHRHLRLVRSLPFRRFYYCDGRPVNLYRQVFRAFLSGRFVSAIVATDSDW